MASNGEICDGSSIAAVNLPSGLRVYFQDCDGYVREARQECGTWRGGTCQNILFRAKPGSPLAATAWGDHHIRVYYVDPKGHLQEFCTDSGVTGDWHLGTFGEAYRYSYQITPDTRLAAATWKNQTRVYYQIADGQIQEYSSSNDGFWSRGEILPYALIGSSLAVVGSFQVYYQDTNGWLCDYICQRGQGDLLVEAPPRTPLSAVYWPSNNDVRVYYRSYSNEVIEIVYTENKWRARPNRLTACIGNSQISSALRDVIEVFYQQNSSALQEYGTFGGSWKMGSVVPTGTKV
ncbi:fucose-specific lectin [Wilcoxina mikolae CBS 423.85]|nr:fucose-specific lectin [Wilcoxina mikolae CBS 423.85]